MECEEVGLALMEDKVKMISLKEQLNRNRERLVAKIMKRRMKNFKQPVPTVIIGNKDHGVPFKGKDLFSGQNRKFADRNIQDYTMENEDGTKRVVNRLFVYDNSKYTGSGKLKD